MDLTSLTPIEQTAMRKFLKDSSNKFSICFKGLNVHWQDVWPVFPINNSFILWVKFSPVKEGKNGGGAIFWWTHFSFMTLSLPTLLPNMASTSCSWSHFTYCNRPTSVMLLCRHETLYFNVCKSTAVATSPSSLVCSSKTVSKTRAIFSSLTEVVMFSQSHIQRLSTVAHTDVSQSSRRHCWRLSGHQWQDVEGSRGTLGYVKQADELAAASEGGQQCWNPKWLLQAASSRPERPAVEAAGPAFLCMTRLSHVSKT